MSAYKDEKEVRGSQTSGTRTEGTDQGKIEVGFRTKDEAEIWERDFMKRMLRASSMGFSLACGIYLERIRRACEKLR